MNFQMFKLNLEKAEEPEIKLPTYVRSLKKQESSRKISTSASLTMPKPLTVWERLGKTKGRREKGTTEDEMAGWHHRLNRDEFE